MTTQWLPIEDGDVLPEKFGKEFQISGNGAELTMASEGTVIWADLPDDMRLCRLVEVPTANAEILYNAVMIAHGMTAAYHVQSEAEMLRRIGQVLGDAIGRCVEVDAPVALDAPDGPGHWALEARLIYRNQHVEYKGAVYIMPDDLQCKRVRVDGKMIDISNIIRGKWTRVFMPWEQVTP